MSRTILLVSLATTLAVTMASFGEDRPQKSLPRRVAERAGDEVVNFVMSNAGSKKKVSLPAMIGDHTLKEVITYGTKRAINDEELNGWIDVLSLLGPDKWNIALNLLTLSSSTGEYEIDPRLRNTDEECKKMWRILQMAHEKELAVRAQLENDGNRIERRITAFNSSVRNDARQLDKAARDVAAIRQDLLRSRDRMAASIKAEQNAIEAEDRTVNSDPKVQQYANVSRNWLTHFAQATENHPENRQLAARYAGHYRRTGDLLPTRPPWVVHTTQMNGAWASEVNFNNQLNREVQALRRALVNRVARLRDTEAQEQRNLKTLEDNLKKRVADQAQQKAAHEARSPKLLANKRALEQQGGEWKKKMRQTQNRLAVIELLRGLCEQNFDDLNRASLRSAEHPNAQPL